MDRARLIKKLIEKKWPTYKCSIRDNRLIVTKPDSVTTTCNQIFCFDDPRNTWALINDRLTKDLQTSECVICFESKNTIYLNCMKCTAIECLDCFIDATKFNDDEFNFIHTCPICRLISHDDRDNFLNNMKRHLPDCVK